MAHAEKCPVCDGSGQYEFRECHGCGGKGWITVEDCNLGHVPNFIQPYYTPYYPSYIPEWREVTCEYPITISIDYS